MPRVRDPFGYRELACRIDDLTGQIAAFRHEMEQKMSALSDKLDTVDAAVAKLGTDLTKTLADLKQAIIDAGGSSDDVNAALTRLDAVAAQLGNFDSQTVAADPQTPPPAA